MSTSSLKLDLVYLIVLIFAQFLLFSPLLGRLYPEFLFSYNFIVWAAVCGIGFAVYPWLCRPSRSRFLTSLIHLIAIFVISTALSFAVIGFTSSDHFAEWQLGLFFIAVPSSIASIASFLLSYAALHFTRHA